MSLKSLNRFALSISALSFVFLAGCASNQKQRLDLRDRMANSSGMFCEFVSGDIYNDVDVEMNLRMAKRCDSTLPFSITNYKNSSENFGVIYCCNLAKKDKEKPQKPAAPTVRPEDQLELDEDEKTTSSKPNENNPSKRPGAPEAKPNTPANQPANAPQNSNTPAAKPSSSTAPTGNRPTANRSATPSNLTSRTLATPSSSSSANTPSSSATRSTSSVPNSPSNSSGTLSNPSTQSPTKAPNAEVDADILAD